MSTNRHEPETLAERVALDVGGKFDAWQFQFPYGKLLARHRAERAWPTIVLTAVIGMSVGVALTIAGLMLWAWHMDRTVPIEPMEPPAVAPGKGIMT